MAIKHSGFMKGGGSYKRVNIDFTSKENMNKLYYKEISLEKTIEKSQIKNKRPTRFLKRITTNENG